MRRAGEGILYSEVERASADALFSLGGSAEREKEIAYVISLILLANRVSVLLGQCRHITFFPNAPAHRTLFQYV